MKKLMTMIAAAATAFGLYAATVADTGTSFEGTSGGALGDVLGDLTELGSGTKANYWGLSGITGDATAEVTMFESGEAISDDNRPAQFNPGIDLNDYYLKLKTGSAALTRYYSATMVEQEHMTYNVANDDTLFFDSLVKLTGFEDAPEVTGAKLALWLSAVDTDASTSTVGETNLYVSVGGDPINCGPRPYLLDAWARVTIKAMPVTAGKDKMGFVVFVNQAAVSAVDAMSYASVELTPQAQYYADAGQLFLTEGTTIESVSFQGQGSVDDLVFTQTAPKFAEDAKVFPISWDMEKVASVTVEESDDYTVDTSKPGVITVVYKDGKDYGEIAYSWVGAGNYLDGSKTVTATKGGSLEIGDDVKLAKALFNDEKCETLDAAVEKANKAEANCTIKLLDQEEGYQAALTFENANDVVITLDLNGCTIECSDELAAATIDVAAGTKLVITDTSDGAAGVIQAYGFTGTDFAGLALNVAGADELGAVAAEVTVDAGTFNGCVLGDITISSEDPKFDFIDNGSIEEGCLISYTMGEGLEGYVLAVDDAEAPTYWVVTAPPVAKIDDVEYTSFAEAFAAANEAGDKTINILRDCSFNEALTNTAAMTIDIPQGMTLSWTGDKGIYPFVVKADLTLTGAGTIEKDTDSASLFILGTADVAENNVKMTLNGPTLTTPASQIIKASYGDLDVLAGSIVNTNSANRSISVQFGRTATIKGGFIKGEIVNNRETEGNDGIIVIPTDTTARFDRPNGFAPEGYKFVIDKTIVGATWYKIAEAISVTSIETEKTMVTGVKIGDCFAEGEEITFTVTADAGAELSGWAYVNGNAVKIGEDGACTYTVVWQDISNKGKIEIVARASVPGPTPINPDEPEVVTAADEEEAKNQVQVKRPAGIGDSIVTAEDYDKYFVKSATLIQEIPGVGGIYTVTATLDPEIIKAATATEATLAEVLKLTAAGNITLTADQVKPGLYYSLKQGEKLDVRMEGDRKLATKDGVTLLAGKWANSGFYQLLVNWKAPDKEETQEEAE